MSFSSTSDAVLNAVNRVFGTTATYTYSVGGTSSISGVFDNAFLEINGITTKRPVLRIVLSHLDHDPVDGDTVLIGSTTYTVRDSHHDAYGGSTLILEK